MLLRYDIRKMDELLQSFYQLTKIRIVVFNDAFQKVAEAPGYDSDFCRLVRSDPRGEKGCRASDQYACEQCRASDSLYTYTCHAGLTETVAPIHYGKMVIGYLMFGQVLQQADAQSYWPEVLGLCGGYQVDEGKLHTAYQKKRPVKLEQVYAAAKILEACAGYLWLERSISLKEDSLPSRIDEYITTHLDADLSVAALCRQFDISRSKLYQVAQEYYGCGVEQVTRALRVERAKELLETTDHPVSEVSFQVGYRDYNYFIKVFKKEMGLTPSKYRKDKSVEER